MRNLFLKISFVLMVLSSLFVFGFKVIAADDSANCDKAIAAAEAAKGISNACSSDYRKDQKKDEKYNEGVNKDIAAVDQSAQVVAMAYACIISRNIFANLTPIEIAKKVGFLEGQRTGKEASLKDAKDKLDALKAEIENIKKDIKDKKDAMDFAGALVLDRQLAVLNTKLAGLTANVFQADIELKQIDHDLDLLNKAVADSVKVEELLKKIKDLQDQRVCLSGKLNQIDNTPEIRKIKPDKPIDPPEQPKPKECPFPSDAANKAGARIPKDIAAIGSDPNGVFRALGVALNEFANKKDDASAQAINEALDAMNRAADQDLFYFGPQGLADYKALREAVNEFKKCLKERNCPPGKPGDPKPNKDGKKVYFFTGAVGSNGRSWCGPCQTWKDNNPGYSNINGLVVVEFLRPDNPGLADPSQKSIVDKYYNGGAGVPQFVFVDKDGNKVSGSAFPSIQSIKDFLNK